MVKCKLAETFSPKLELIASKGRFKVQGLGTLNTWTVDGHILHKPEHIQGFVHQQYLFSKDSPGIRFVLGFGV